MRIAVIGAGISGLVTAYLLGDDHEVFVYEANARLGGHTHTVQVEHGKRTYAIDTGFIVYNERTYPNFCKLLDRLDVATQTSAMSFSVSCDQTGLEYNGTNLNGLFAQRRNLLSLRFYAMLRDIVRFNRDAKRMLGRDEGELTLDRFLERGRYGRTMIERYLLPMGAAIWSTDVERFRRFPARFLAEFMNNHGMLNVSGRPVWCVITGGSHRYVEALTARTRATWFTQTPVRAVARQPTGVTVVTDRGPVGYDHVVFACHSDQALGLLEAPTADEARALRAIPYQPNEVVLHTDASLLPRSRRAWAAWNYRIGAEPTDRVTVTYNMNVLQSLDAEPAFCVTLNETGRIDPAAILRRFTYHHPLYTAERSVAHGAYERINHRNRTSFCGAYWGYGFHEDGVNSALAVCRPFGKGLA